MNPSEFKERNWRKLLDDISQGIVVPVIGDELLNVAVDGKEIPLYQYIAQELMERLDIAGLEKSADLSDVIYKYRQRGGALDDPYYEIWHILERVVCSPPAALRQLASINAFQVFISTTFDRLMAKALDEERYQGQARTLQFSFKRSARPDDLPRAFDAKASVVYHVFGQASKLPTYVATEDDLLTFSRLWQDDDKRPVGLCSYLRDKYLLVLGCGYQNWLSRFFLSALKGDGLFDSSNRCGVFADKRLAGDEEFSLFLSRCQGHVYSAGGAAEFIAELSKRWQAYESASPSSKKEDALVANQFVSGSIFLSYASEDREIVAGMRNQFEASGLDVWMDTRQLEAGDDYRSKILRNIDHASLFVPVLSKHVETTDRRFFRLEWDRAIEEAKLRSPAVPFIHPVVVDATKPVALIREEICERQWTPLTGGRLPDDFIEQCRKHIRQLRREEVLR